MKPKPIFLKKPVFAITFFQDSNKKSDEPFALSNGSSLEKIGQFLRVMSWLQVVFDPHLGLKIGKKPTAWEIIVPCNCMATFACSAREQKSRKVRAPNPPLCFDNLHILVLQDKKYLFYIRYS